MVIPLLGFLLLLITKPIQCYLSLEQRAACNKDNLLNSFTNPTRSAEASSFCSAYISIPLTSYAVDHAGQTCTLYTWSWSLYTLHPMNLYNLQRQTSGLTGLSYNSASPTPSPVPGGSQNYYPPIQKHKRDAETQDESFRNVFNDQQVGSSRAIGSEQPMITSSPIVSPSVHEMLRRASTAVPLPSWLATTYPPSRVSSACSCISPSASITVTQTYPDYTQITTGTCPYYSTSPTTSVPAFCVATGQVNAAQPSSGPGFRASNNFPVANKMECCVACSNYFNCIWWKFDFGTKGDGWKPGTCHFGYYIGKPKSTDPGNVPAICPNGIVKGIDAPAFFKGSHDAVNKDGYNFGACGGTGYLFQSDQDFGYPENPENNCNPDYYDGPCG